MALADARALRQRGLRRAGTFAGRSQQGAELLGKGQKLFHGFLAGIYLYGE